MDLLSLLRIYMFSFYNSKTVEFYLAGGSSTTPQGMCLETVVSMEQQILTLFTSQTSVHNINSFYPRPSSYSAITV